MMPNEGRVAMLRALLEQPMVLSLFTKGPARDNDFATAHDFTLAISTKPMAVEFRAWIVDEENAQATLEKKTFTFASAGEHIAGWVLRTRKENRVVGLDHFASPYPINSKDDKLSVRPKLQAINMTRKT
jgi:hypothetical protein